MSRNIDVAVQCLHDEARAIEALIPRLAEDFDRAVETILKCTGKLIITGVGKSGHIGAKIAATMSSTGTPSFFVNPLDVFHGDLGVIGKDDVVLTISNSGQTDELLRFLPYLISHGIPVISMTGNSDSLLARNSNIHLYTGVDHEACPLNLAPTCSTTATLAMGDALACALMVARGFQAHDFALFHPGGSLGRKLLTRARDVMQTENLPVIDGSTNMDEALVTMSNGRLGLLIAVKDNHVEGIVTDGDVRRAMEHHHTNFFHSTVAENMTRNPKCVSPDTKIVEIDDMMHKNKIHCVLVTDEEHRLIGVIDSFKVKL